MALRTAGLFSGIGGMELGLTRAGHSTQLLCELDDGARHILAQHFPDARLAKDVRFLKSIGKKVDLLAAGFPCQDLSSAGRLGGIGGVNSGLVGHVFRLLKRNRVQWVLLENVPFMLKLDKGAAIKQLTTAFEHLGYKWAYRVIDSRAFGVPHRRLRVFILASLDHDPRQVLLSSNYPLAEQSFALTEAAHGFYWTEGNRGIGWAENAIPALKGGSGLNIPSPPAILLKDLRVVVPTLRAAERLQGFPLNWTNSATRAGFGKRRWAYLGNAVTVNVAKWIGKKLVSPVPYDSTGDTIFTDGPWPYAAWFDGKIRSASTASIWPQKPKAVDLEDFLRGHFQCLSGRAAAGFLARLENSSLRSSASFRDAIARHIDSSGATATFISLKAAKELQKLNMNVPTSSISIGLG